MNHESTFKYGIQIFEDTPVFELMHAVDSQDKAGINKFLDKNNTLINFQEETFGFSPLMWAVGMNKKTSVEILLKNNADPNTRAINGMTCLYLAILGPWNNTGSRSNIMLELLLENNADPNQAICLVEESYNGEIFECGITPLILASSSTVDKVKLLLEHGAELDFKTDLGMTAASKALMMKRVDISHLLIVQHKADVKNQFTIQNKVQRLNLPDVTKTPSNLLIEWVFMEDDKKYYLKQEIINEFTVQNVKYHELKKDLPKNILHQIKTLFPNNWENYIEVY